jgi:uncharacterized protein YciI
MARFAVEYIFAADTEKRLAIRPTHREWLAVQQSEGKLLASGPWASDTGALLIFEAEDETSLKELLEHDPYMPADVISRVRINEWNAGLGVWVTG